LLVASVKHLQVDNAKLIQAWQLDNLKHLAEVESVVAEAFVLLPQNEPEHLTSKFYVMKVAASF